MTVTSDATNNGVCPADKGNREHGVDEPGRSVA